MKKLKRMLAFCMSIILLSGQLSMVAYSSIDGYTIIDGSPVQSMPPESLAQGEIWTGKSVAYNGDGTATVTLSAWGRTWDDPDDPGTPKLPLDSTRPYVTITDHLGEFKLVTTSMTSGVTIGEGNTVIWNAHQYNIIGTAPVQVSYVVYLDEVEWRTGYWYSSGIADVSFYPVKGNPFYWTKVETTYNAFNTSVNWNNGNGMNSGTITDNMLGITIVLGSNTSPANQKAADALTQHWANNARIGDMVYQWHLEWLRGGGPKTHVITIRDLEASGIDIIYEVIFPNPGGNAAIPGGRTLVSTEDFHRGFKEGNPEYLFTWDGDAIVCHLDAVVQIQLALEAAPTGTLQLNKMLEGWFEIDWDVGDQTPFHAIMTNQDGYYLTFRAEENIHEYAYTGLVRSRELATVIDFSVDKPAILLGVPIQATGLQNALPFIYFIEEIFDIKTDLVEITYSFDEKGIQLTEGELTQATIINNYKHGIGYLEIYKLFDGFSTDWGVDDDTVFYVRIWDVDYGNYLLFKESPEPDGTYWCVGNHIFGLTEDYQGTPMLEIPISANSPVKLSNLWTWGRYEVREVRMANDQPIGAEWGAFWNDIKLDRDPTFKNRDDGVWADGIWMDETWLDNWEYVKIITDEGAWNEDNNWTHGVMYSDNNGVQELEFNETIVVTATNRYKHSSGNMTIIKDLAGHLDCWGITKDTVFHATVSAVGGADNPGSRNTLIFEAVRRAYGDYTYRNIGYIDAAGNTVFYMPDDRGIDFLQVVPFAANAPALVTDLPVDEDTHYIVEEYFTPGAIIDHITTSYTFNNGAIVSPGGIKISADEASSLVVRVINEYAHGEGNLIVVKELDGFPEDWGVDEFTEFYAGVRIEGTQEYMHFSLEADDRYQYRPADEAYNGNLFQFIPFSAARSTVITGLNSHFNYVVDEFCANGRDIGDIFSVGFEVSISYFTENFVNGGNIVATVTNRFEHGVGTLRVEKRLVNQPDSVDEDTMFYAIVRDATDVNDLIWILLDEEENIWHCVGNDIDWISENVTAPIYDRIGFSVSKPATLTNLWSGRVYVVSELDDDITFVASYQQPGVMWNGDELTAVVTNEWAKFHQNPDMFKVFYDGNGHTDGIEPEDPWEYPEEYAWVMILEEGDLAKDEHIFIGWNTQIDGRGDMYQSDDLFTMPAHDVTFYAQWEPITVPLPTYRVFYDGNGNTDGIAPTDDTDYLENQTTIIMGKSTLVKDEHNFIGWTTDDNGEGTLYQAGDEYIMPAMDVTFYAQWRKPNILPPPSEPPPSEPPPSEPPPSEPPPSE
ncbi:MAG: InlB B-repeat-containing protein, partial [Oscillospiraceae bacterium]|nr:InlB B-repeat-containing protein [Oscillospiraceae bacterium]